MKTGDKIQIIDGALDGKIISSDAHRTRFCVEYEDEGEIKRRWFYAEELREVENKVLV